MALEGVAAPAGAVAVGVAEASEGGGEEGRTRGLKLWPPRVLAMLGCLEKGGNGEARRISFL